MVAIKAPARKDALATLTMAVAAHRAGGELTARLQPDWSDGAGLPTIVVRIGNHVTIRQRGSYDEAAKSLLAWVSGQTEAVVPAARP